jgi:hypothetical protein
VHLHFTMIARICIEERKKKCEKNEKMANALLLLEEKEIDTIVLSQLQRYEF